MNQLILQDFGFSLIPKAAEKDFIKLIGDWYEFVSEEHDVPYLRNQMLDHERIVADVFSDFFFEIRAYTYATGTGLKEFPKGVFPVDAQAYLDYSFYEEQAYVDAADTMEFAFFSDMKKYLDMNKMFYQDSYSWDLEVKTQYYNVPIKEVW
jgi:hypothetical protein